MEDAGGPRWQQEGSLPGELKFEFVGVDARALEAREIRRFQRALAEPSKEDLRHMDTWGRTTIGGLEFEYSLGPLMPMTPEFAIRMVVGGFLGYAVSTIVSRLGFDSLAAAILGVLSFPVFAFADRIYFALRRKIGAKPLPQQRFVLRMSPVEISLQGEHTEERSFLLKDVRQFTGRTHVAVELQTGERIVLTSSPQPEFMEELNTQLATARSLGTSYRGEIGFLEDEEAIDREPDARLKRG